MSSLENNLAAWQEKPSQTSLVIGPGPDHRAPAADEIVVKVDYVAINPIDWKLQRYNFLPIQYPTIHGKDVAGHVVLVGKDVTRFKTGDRVIGHSLGFSYENEKYGGFQLFVTLRERVAARVPQHIDLAKAVVLPLAISTATTGLFEQLGLDLPSSRAAVISSKVVLIWGASSSVGSVAVQLARAAGYKVVATAGKKNIDFVRGLGAWRVFDHTDPDVVRGITELISGETLAGAMDAISEASSISAVLQIVKQVGGGCVAVTLPSQDAAPDTVDVKMINGSAPGVQETFKATSVWKEFVPDGLASGSLKPTPGPMIIEGGLASLQKAMDRLAAGVSAQKVVVQIASGSDSM